MVSYYVRQKGTVTNEPSIFVAAANDDVAQLAICLQRGESLDDIDSDTSFTPVHLAIITGSVNFLRAAMTYAFNPWVRDCNQRLAIDHAAAKGLRETQRALHSKMYPPGWADRPQDFTP